MKANEFERYTYLGNCTDSFDPDTGDSLISEFYDVSDFANQDEKATEITKQDFHRMVVIPPAIAKIENKYSNHIKYLAYDNGLLVLYVEPIWLNLDDEHGVDKEQDTDIHYFFGT